jgi:hypothetical protein
MMEVLNALLMIDSLIQTTVNTADSRVTKSLFDNDDVTRTNMNATLDDVNSIFCDRSLTDLCRLARGLWWWLSKLYNSGVQTRCKVVAKLLFELFQII